MHPVRQRELGVGIHGQVGPRLIGGDCIRMLIYLIAYVRIHAVFWANDCLAVQCGGQFSTVYRVAYVGLDLRSMGQFGRNLGSAQVPVDPVIDETAIR